MRIYIVTASVNVLTNVVKLTDELLASRHETKILVVDEGQDNIRAKNQVILKDLPKEFLGPGERANWFRDRFHHNYERYLPLIPAHSHSETSFGFLVAWEDCADVILEIDDDVKFPDGELFLGEHLDNLSHCRGTSLSSKSKWYNTLDSLILNRDERVFPRGHPYESSARADGYEWADSSLECALNMGHWIGVPDLDAMTHLLNGGLDGRGSIVSESLKREKVIVNPGTYFAVCSMNTSFRRKVIPAFYQLYMGHLGIDRFDDIWSGLFLKKVADHLGDAVCLGKPVVYHDKRPRPIWRDLKAELKGMVINEQLWRVIDKVDLRGSSYYDCYNELADGIEGQLSTFRENSYQQFVEFQLQKMRLWLRTIDALG